MFGELRKLTDEERILYLDIIFYVNEEFDDKKLLESGGISLHKK